MKPVAVIGALITIGLSFFVVSRLTAPTREVVPPVTPPPEVKPEEPKAEDGKTADNPDSDAAKAAAKADEDLNYQSNPFDLKQPGPHPKAKLVEERFEFGEMPLGSTRSHVFVVKNEGTVPLKIEKGPLQCKCTMPALKDKSIPPGGQADIVLEWKPLATQPDFEKEAVIWTNDPGNPRLSITIFGAVVAEDVWEPTDNINLGQLKQGEERIERGMVYSKVRDNLKIERVDQAGNTLKVEYEPMTEEQLKEKEAKSGFAFKITVPPSEEIALVRETITLTVNSATNTQIIWNVFGNRVGPVSIIGPGWYSEKQLIQMGHFRAAEGAEKKYSLFLSSPAEKPMELTGQVVDGPIKVELVKDEKWMGKGNERYFLTVRFVPGGAIGVKTIESALPVTVTTNHPKVPSINFNVSYDAD